MSASRRPKSWLAVSILAAACATARRETTATPHPSSFATPQEAVAALAASVDEPADADALLGPGGADLLSGGDADDEEDLALVREKLTERVAFADAGPDTQHVLLGSEAWELPLPLVRDGGRWRFDVAAGEDEARCRSIGRNELHAIATMRELPSAQGEFFDAQRETLGAAHGSAEPAYATQWASTPGRHDGLYWEVAAGEPESPLGPRFCHKALDSADPSESAPCHGYCFRILTTSGPRAGFAFIAWPSEYGECGVMTFEVDAAGIVFQKDLGAESADAARALTAFAPDQSWEPVRE